MKDSDKLHLVTSTVMAGDSVMQKSASAEAGQTEILEAGWPREDEQISKTARLSRMLATGLLVQEAEASMG